MREIRVLVVDDSAIYRELITKALSSDPAITVVGTANDPFQARDAIIELKPDVMTLDIEMPRMTGLDFVRKLMPQYPMPVVMISSLSDKVFDAMNAGAVDFVVKPSGANRAEMEEFFKAELPMKIKIASTAKLGGMKKRLLEANSKLLSLHKSAKNDMVIAIGASTGGTEAIASVIKDFGPDIPGVVIVQHMPAGFTQMYAKRLDDQSRVSVKEAENGDVVCQGRVLLAPGGDRQMRLIKVNGQYQVEVKKGPKVSGHCPSVDVLFESVAKTAGKDAIGIILTGMGKDGADGLLKMREAGAMTIGQNESTCVVYGMPKAAYECGAVQYQERLENVAKRTYNLLNKM